MDRQTDGRVDTRVMLYTYPMQPTDWYRSFSMEYIQGSRLHPQCIEENLVVIDVAVVLAVSLSPLRNPHAVL